jgi:hypothetical protein
MFEEGMLNGKQSLPVKGKAVRGFRIALFKNDEARFEQISDRAGKDHRASEKRRLAMQRVMASLILVHGKFFVNIYQPSLYHPILPDKTEGFLVFITSCQYILPGIMSAFVSSLIIFLRRIFRPF